MNRFARWLVLCLLLWTCGAQAATYAYRNDVFSYDTPSASAGVVAWHTSGAAPGCTTYPSGDDDFADIVFASATTPANDFTFTFAGAVQSGVRVYSNGMLAFGNDTSGFWRTYTNTTLPITAQAAAFTGCTRGVPSNLIIPYWNDIVAGTANSTSGASVRYELLGAAPNRRFVISWVNVKLYAQTERYNFQVILYESPAGGLNSNFKFQYTNGSSDGSDATVGVQVSTTDSTLYSFNQIFIDPVAGSAILWYPANQLAGKGAEYRFDEGAWNGTAGEIKDSSGNGQDAVRVGAAASSANGKICRGGSFTSNNSATTIDAVATPITPANVGSIDFWFNSNAKWNTTDAMLIDATASAARPFFLMKSSAGALKFSVTDSAGTVMTVTSANQSFNASTWHHVGVSWNLRAGTNQTLLQIFLDGVLVKTLRTTSTGAIAALTTIDLGDNATSGVTPSGGTIRGANGLFDEVNIYGTEINASQATADMNDTRPSCAAFDHFHISHGGALVNCGNAVANITIEAHDTNHAAYTLSGATINLSTSTNHGTWSTVTGGSINPVVNLGNGAGTYTFSGESSVILGLQNNFSESTNINVTAGVFTERSGTASTCVAQDYTYGSVCDANISFDSAGFRFVDSSGNNIANQRAGIASGTYYLQAVKSSCTTPGPCTGVCSAVFPPGTSVNVDLAFECNNPGSCQPGQAVTFAPGAGAGTASTIAANGNGALGISSGSYTTRALTFNSVAPNPTPAVPFFLNYPDVGQITLAARSTGSGTTLFSKSAPFVVAPHRFGFSSITSGPIKAGTTFSATLSAINGAPIPGVSPNFGKETVPENVTLTHVKCLPTGAGTSSGNFTGTVGPFNNGAMLLSNLNWSEVGNIDLVANLASGSYLGSGLTATGNTGASGTTCSGVGGAGTVGRFIPDHFDTVVTLPGCGTFTYSGQPFAVAITAKNGLATPTTTVNYDGTALTSPNFARAVTLSDSSGAAGNLTNAAVAAAAFSAGVATLPTPAAAPYTHQPPIFTFTSAQTPPAGITIRATETFNNGTTGDGVTSLRVAPAVSVEGNTPIRSGRIRVANAHGSELLELPLSLTVQYWNAGGFVANTADTCTVILPANFGFVFPGGAANKLNPACKTAVSAVTGSAPSFTAKLARPGSGNGGWADLTLNLGATTTGVQCTAIGAAGPGAASASLPWLQYNWKGAGAADPAARVTFGVYKSGPVIYMREMY
ncbi:DUF6701 domain-containing protein [Janthinobacterium sp. 17J80-10]|uniref:DUF6701 domain-containing protein n=1 Tax=Janthinobacterium sp. 17J80-10 TaxID=2497863 RepID=UPI0010057B54|nr:DUF6701 domain-containing protein [Janthinobacterium sp. 17J80-10]QAU34277.1 hypothetical protein EKL02_08840 [Janthinobacterium sp. 17J80-10]